MQDETRRQAQAILQAIRAAWADLHGAAPAKKRGAAARAHFLAYTKDGPLAPHVRDVYFASTLRGTEAALHTLQQLARAFAEPDEGEQR